MLKEQEEAFWDIIDVFNKEGLYILNPLYQVLEGSLKKIYWN